MPKGIAIDITGQRFGRLIAVQRVKNSPEDQARWLCKCDCGNFHSVRSGKLRSGNTVTCGCRKGGGGGFKHGYATKKNKHPLYKTWEAMHQRCHNPNTKGYKNYGGRGITVDPRWNYFPNFLADVGERPSGHTLDRPNNDLNYGPNNWRWADWSTQLDNRRPLRTDLSQFSTAELETELMRRRVHGYVTPCPIPTLPCINSVRTGGTEPSSMIRSYTYTPGLNAPWSVAGSTLK